jgi:putative transposase
MVDRLERWQESGNLHFVTFSCYQRKGYLGAPEARDLFELVLERTRSRYGFAVVGYVVMPEHVHLLLSEPEKELLSVGLQALKVTMSRNSLQRPFWLPRYYDFNVVTEDKLREKLNYMHWNPMKRGLVDRPEDWSWSSCYYYQTGQQRGVTVDSSWLKS